MTDIVTCPYDGYRMTIRKTEILKEGHFHYECPGCGYTKGAKPNDGL